MQYFLSTSGGTSTDFILACFGGRVGGVGSGHQFRFLVLVVNLVGLVSSCVCGKGIWLIIHPPKQIESFRTTHTQTRTRRLWWRSVKKWYDSKSAVASRPCMFRSASCPPVLWCGSRLTFELVGWSISQHIEVFEDLGIIAAHILPIILCDTYRGGAGPSRRGHRPGETGMMMGYTSCQYIRWLDREMAC